uniref:coiled-coil domain-containing protein 27 n=1 Tax=Euleptes europaea TaxID=460621 RepID=UPI0025412A45|nr:coiled-coil domain-containing protein 27 [Euleptes europaea]
MEKQINLMMKGFNELQEVINRKPQNSVWNPPSSSKINPSKASQVIGQYYKKQAAEQTVTPLLEGYITEADSLQKSFLMRPGCPRYSHMATSTSHLDNTFPKLNHMPVNLSTMALSSQLSLDDWNALCPYPESLDFICPCHPATFSQSMAGLQNWKSFTEISASYPQPKGPSGPRVPWYVSVLNEKDKLLQKLGSELSRLSKCEAECTRKDELISVLREEADNTQRQLDQLQKGGILIQEGPPEAKAMAKEAKGEVFEERAPRRGLSLPVHLGQKGIPDEFRQEIEHLKLELSQSEKVLGFKMNTLSETLLKSQEELEQLEKEYLELHQKEQEESREELICDVGSRATLGGEEEQELEPGGEEETALRKLQESQRMNNELYSELDKVKNNYDVATGAISSLQRQLSFEESQLRRAHAERDLLQKELQERGVQLEAMSAKFCNLREERKHEEMMGSIERENNALRQVVSELESKLAEKTQLIEELQGDVNRLQAQLVINQLQTSKQLTQQKELQRQLDVLQRVEQQTRVMLEAIGTRFERFRNKILQATYSTPGTKSPQSEIGDDEVLETLQKIINDRLEFHQMLRQKGVKLPSLSTEQPVILPPVKTKKGSNPGIHLIVSEACPCDGFGEQICFLTVTPGSKVTLTVSLSISGKHPTYIVLWYKFYSGQSPQFNSYRRRLTPGVNPTKRMSVANNGQALTLLSIDEDDFYPNLFWAELKSPLPPSKTAAVEAYDLMDFQMINPSRLRYFFVLDRVPIEIGAFLEGDTVAVRLPQDLRVSPSSFVEWIKEPRPMTLLDSHAVVLASGVEKIEIRGLMDTDFSYIRALVYDFSSEVPGRVLVAQRLFLIKKDVTKTCNGSRAPENCFCNPGFVGNGVHCVDVDECKRGMPMNCLPEAECVNGYGSYSCRCPQGFEGDGLYSCIDVDECARGSHGCNQDATCLNILGSYICVCPSGFIGDGVWCQAKSTWSPWSPWSLCSATCGFQNQMRIRQCTHPESGMRCVGPSSDIQLCPDLHPCPANGQWSEWSPWAVCSETCSGFKKRLRVCNNPAPSRGGLPCEGEEEEVAPCNKDKCPVDGMWSTWASWTPCPASCGLGVVRRSRQCNSPSPENGGRKCSGHGYEESSCGFPETFCKYLKKLSKSTRAGKLIQ